MSDSSLSPPPLDDYENDSHDLPELSALIHMRTGRELPDSASPLFANGLFIRTILNTNPLKIQI